MSKNKINQRISIPCISNETFQEKKDNGVIIKGKLITCGVPTRNGIAYSQPSMEKFIREFNSSKKTLPFLDSHDDTSIRRASPFGHIQKLFMNGPDVFYEANIDPLEETFLHKLRRGDISEVSLQAIVDAVDEVRESNGDNVVIADVRELLEVSSVLIPGARDTSAEIQNEFISEERFVETFRHAKRNNITFKESLKRLNEAKDDNEYAGGQINEPKEEDLTTGNAGALIGTELPKKIRKVPEEILKKSKYLKIISKRF